MYGKGPGSCLGHVSDKKKKKKDNNKKTVHTCDALRVVVVNKCIADIKLPVSGLTRSWHSDQPSLKKNHEKP